MFKTLIDKLKSKRYTHNKITRMLLHILCGFTKEKATQFKDITYIRILGFSKKGQEYLNKIKKQVEIPIISKINREKDPMLEFELHVNTIYSLTDQNEVELNKKEYRNLMSKGE